jgi:hypothetical protein
MFPVRLFYVICASHWAICILLPVRTFFKSFYFSEILSERPEQISSLFFFFLHVTGICHYHLSTFFLHITFSAKTSSFFICVQFIYNF